MRGKFFLMVALVLGLSSALVVKAEDQAEKVEAIPDVNPYSGDPERIKKGMRYFRQNTCTACHGGRADGQGDMGTGADLRKLKLGYKRFVQTVKSGRRVEGRQQFMPSFAHLSVDEISHIGAYLETLAHPEANWKEGVRN